MKNNKRNIGNYYEKIAIKFLQENQYQIVATNYQYKTIDYYKPLELDIVATKDNIIYFFEVKYRSRLDGYFPCNPKKLLNIEECSRNFLYHHPQYNQFWPQIQWIIINKSIEILNIN
jgi:Holliday junction resolvase-like predicted endonuclease